MDTATLTISQALEQISRHEISVESLVKACLDKIKQLNERYKCFITILEEQSMELARSIDVGKYTSGRLIGIPVALKDLFETSGIRTTAGSSFFADYYPRYDAHVVERLKTEGAIVVGKTNLHEIALGVTNVNPYYGVCRNPWNENRITGGSSGGSAVAVLTGMSLGALGTDTGGSIRIPASLCGIVGFKPTYGLVSLRGVMPLSWNLDHVGPMARSVQDAAILLNMIAGFDSQDPYSVEQPTMKSLTDSSGGVKGWRIAMACGTYIEDSDPEILEAFYRSGDLFRQLDAEVVEVEIPFLHQAAQTNGQIVQADAAAVHRERLAKAPQNFSADVRQRLMSGAALSSTEYILARRTQSKITHWFDHFFRKYDVLLLPTTPTPATLIEGTDALEQARQLTRFTAPFNLIGTPALSAPCGLTKSGLPIGLQIVAGKWQDISVLRAAKAFEEIATNKEGTRIIPLL